MTTRSVALVTGTSSGIGLWTAVGLARSGMHVVATMRSPDRADRLRAAAAEAGVEVDVRALDVTDRLAAADCVAHVQQQHGAIEVLVNTPARGRSQRWSNWMTLPCRRSSTSTISRSLP